MKRRSKRVPRNRRNAKASVLLEKSVRGLASVYGEGVELGPPGEGNYNVALPPGEKHVPLCLMFYDPKLSRFAFSRTPGIDLQEFISIMRRLLPNYMNEQKGRLDRACLK